MAHILIIDDDPHLLQMLGVILEQAGHRCTVAEHGQKGIELAIQDPPDLAIVDVMMPEISGHEVCRHLRAHPATVDVPLLILTARAQTADREIALDSGADDYLAKPVAPKELAAKVAEMLAQVSTRKHHGVITTLFSLKGGVGATTLAVNLAVALRAQRVPNVSLVDLSPNSGHVALQLRVQPQRTWGQLLGYNELTGDAVRSLVIGHPSGLHLLAAPPTPTLNASLTEKQMSLVLQTLAEKADFVIVDAPATFSPMCISALKNSDYVMLVMNPDIASVHTVTGTIRGLMELGVSGKKVHLVLNHTCDQQGLPKQAVERALRRPISFEVPFDANQSRALSKGAPVSGSDPESALPTAIQSMAAALKKTT